MADAGGFESSVVVGGFMLVIFRLPRWVVGLVLLSEVSWSSFLAREVVEAARGNRHFESGRWFDVASVVSALFTYKMNIFGGKIFNCRSDVLLQSSMSRCRSRRRRRSWRRAILLATPLLSSRRRRLGPETLVKILLALRRYWNVEFNVRSRSRMFCTQIHSHNTYTHTACFDRVYYLSGN